MTTHTTNQENTMQIPFNPLPTRDPDGTKARPEYGVRWPGPWPDSGGFMSPESAQRYATRQVDHDH